MPEQLDRQETRGRNDAPFFILSYLWQKLEARKKAENKSFGQLLHEEIQLMVQEATQLKGEHLKEFYRELGTEVRMVRRFYYANAHLEEYAAVKTDLSWTEEDDRAVEELALGVAQANSLDTSVPITEASDHHVIGVEKLLIAKAASIAPSAE